jgi:hypothetical protein
MSRNRWETTLVNYLVKKRNIYLENKSLLLDNTNHPLNNITNTPEEFQNNTKYFLIIDGKLYVGEYNNDGFECVLMFDKSKGDTSYVKNEWIVLRASERRTVANNEIAANNISVYSCDLLNDPKYNDIMELMEALNSEVFIGSSFYNSRKNYNTLVQGTNLETGHNTPITRHLMNEDMQKEINSFIPQYGGKKSRKINRKTKKSPKKSLKKSKKKTRKVNKRSKK